VIPILLKEVNNAFKNIRWNFRSAAQGFRANTTTARYLLNNSMFVSKYLGRFHNSSTIAVLPSISALMTKAKQWAIRTIQQDKRTCVHTTTAYGRAGTK
jgi:hypothetical protein